MSEAYTWISSLLGLSEKDVNRIDSLFSTHGGGVEDMYRRFLLKKESIPDIDTLFLGASELEDGLLSYFSSPQLSPEGFSPLFHEVQEEVGPPSGWVLSWDVFRKLILSSPPPGTLHAFGYGSAEELVSNESLYDIAAGLRFLESKEWLHNSFFPLYEKLSFSDFEYRSLHFHMLSEKYASFADAFVEKKYHNVSHLKELGLIFVIPTKRVFEGQLLRTLLLLFHYLYEISFYTRLFEYHKEASDFGSVLSSLLRGDVIEEKIAIPENTILIIQRYLSKENIDDWRLVYPHINPEALHWYKAEKSFLSFVKKKSLFLSSLWEDTSWMGYIEGEKRYSFNIMDVSMSAVRGYRDNMYTYHQHEALWNEWYGQYHGYEMLEDKIITSMDKGYIA